MNYLPIAFGTYRIPPADTAEAVRRALRHGIRKIDTAELYRNDAEVFEVVRAHEARGGAPVHVTSKIYDNLLFEPTLARVEAAAQVLGRPLDRMLLHRPVPTVMWRALDAAVERGLVREIGVSNYAIHHLEHLLQICGPCRPPGVNQVELHPLVGPVQALLSFCKAKAIALQGHSIFARGALLEHPPLLRIAERLGAPPAAVLLRWVRQSGAEPVFSSAVDAHVEEVALEATAQATLLSPRDMAELNGLHTEQTRKLYPEAPLPEVVPELRDVTDTEAYVEAVVELLSADRDALTAGAPVSEAALSLTTSSNRQLLHDPIANRIAVRLFPVPEGKPPQSSHQRYRDLVRELRRAALDARKGRPKPKTKSCAVPATHPARRPPRHVEGAPVSSAVAYPAAMPVEVGPRDELQPFFDFLAAPERFGVTDLARAVTFPRGTLFADERMDLCKQVVGPDHVEALCAAVEAGRAGPARVRHFLLGNNLACDGPSTAGAEAFARLMANPELDIETWYLAGNCIGPRDVEIIAEGLRKDRAAKALWLKRNPIGPEGAYALGRLLGDNDTLELLDLHNTGLFDEGVEALVDGVQASGGALTLRQLYLCANALTARSVEALGRLFAGAAPAPIDSLYLSINRLSNAGLDALVALLRGGALPGLTRLDVGGVGLEAPDLGPLVDTLIEACPALICLDLGTYRSTRDMGEQANLLDPDVAPLLRLLSEHPSLALLDVTLCGLPEASLERLVEGRRDGQSVEGIGRRALEHDHDTRRRLRHAPRVVDIDSVYRGR